MAKMNDDTQVTEPLSLHSLILSLHYTCCYDLTKGTQDKDFSYSFSDSLSALYIGPRSILMLIL